MKIIKNEHELKNLIKSINHSYPGIRAFYSMLTAMLCILHREMRIALSILNKTFIEGYSNCVEANIHSEIGGTGPARFDQYVKDIEKIVNTEIFGNHNNVLQW